MDKWEKRGRPLRLEKRFEFQSYEKTRDFLDCLGELSEAVDRFPDISFGKTYVNITLRPDADDAEFNDLDYKFVDDIDGLLN